MANFKRTTSVNGKLKNLCVIDGKFVDAESAEEIDVADILEKVYGRNAFDISTSYKSDEDIE